MLEEPVFSKYLDFKAFLHYLTTEACAGCRKEKCKLFRSCAGSAVFKACVNYAISRGAQKLTLISNHILKPALHIYEKFRFRRVELRENEYAQADVKYEFLCSGRQQSLPDAAQTV